MTLLSPLPTSCASDRHTLLSTLACPRCSLWTSSWSPWSSWTQVLDSSFVDSFFIDRGYTTFSTFLPRVRVVVPSPFRHLGVLRVLEGHCNPSLLSPLTDLVVFCFWSSSFSYFWPLLRCLYHVPCLLR